MRGSEAIDTAPDTETAPDKAPADDSGVAVIVTPTYCTPSIVVDADNASAALSTEIAWLPDMDAVAVSAFVDFDTEIIGDPAMPLIADNASAAISTPFDTEAVPDTLLCADRTPADFATDTTLAPSIVPVADNASATIDMLGFAVLTNRRPPPPKEAAAYVFLLYSFTSPAVMARLNILTSATTPSIPPVYEKLE